jgi:sec-independent protein translocase protein TatB
MFPLEQGAFEMILIGAIALIVVGPKDLPMLMRKVGQFTAKMRGLAAEFRASFDEMARQSELDELRKEVEALRTGQYVAPVTTEIDHHLSSFNPYPTGYPSPPADAVAEPSTTAVTPTETSPVDASSGALIDATPIDGVTPALNVGPATGDAIAAAKPKKPRAPRKPKPAPDAGEAAE